MRLRHRGPQPRRTRSARYFLWLGDVLHGDFGISARTQQPVCDDLTYRVPMTLKLVGAAPILSILVGIAVGIVTALRQYSGFDYLTTFFTFVFFSLPVFWVAVILKGIGGINFNDWLRDGAHFSAVVHRPRRAARRRSRLQRRRRPHRRAGWRSPPSAAASFTGVLIYISATQWLLDPGFGPVVAGDLRRRHRLRRHGRDGRRAQPQGAQQRAHHGRHRRRARGSRCRPCFDSDAMNLWMLLGLGVVADRSSASPSATPSAASTRACRRAPAAVTALLVVGRRSSSTGRCSRGTSTRRTR